MEDAAVLLVSWLVGGRAAAKSLPLCCGRAAAVLPVRRGKLW